MKNGKLELFDDVMTNHGKGQIRHIAGNNRPYMVVYENPSASVDGYGWLDEFELTYIPKQPVMVYVSDESEADAVRENRKRKLVFDFKDRFNSSIYRYITINEDGGGWTGWRFAVPVDQVNHKPTITKAELQQAQDLLEKVKNGAVVIEGE